MDKALRITGFCMAVCAVVAILTGMVLSGETKKERKIWEGKMNEFRQNGSLNKLPEDSMQNAVVDGFVKDVERYGNTLSGKERITERFLYTGATFLTIGITCLFVGIAGGIRKNRNMLLSFE